MSDFIFSVSVPSQEKKLGKKGDMAQLRAHLDSLGLKIVEVTADGNCFFRFSRSGFFGLYCICHKKKKLTDFEQNTFC